MGITSADKDDSTVSFQAAFREWWNDTRMIWDPADYGGVERIWFKTGDILGQVWTSDAVVVEDAGDSYFSNFKDTLVMVNSNGTHYWSRVGELKVKTSFNFNLYPYDRQIVNITIGSWIYDDNRISYIRAPIPLLIQSS